MLGLERFVEMGVTDDIRLHLVRHHHERWDVGEQIRVRQDTGAGVWAGTTEAGSRRGFDLGTRIKLSGGIVRADNTKEGHADVSARREARKINDQRSDQTGGGGRAGRRADTVRHLSGPE